MKISNLGNLDHSSCMLVKINNVHIMLDCSADISSLTPFLPVSPLHLPRLDDLDTAPNYKSPVLKQTAGGMVSFDHIKCCFNYILCLCHFPLEIKIPISLA